jgi:biotin synthase-like enzyme
MNGIDVLSAPILLLLSVISFIIHFRNERKKSLIERPFFAGSADSKKKTMPDEVDVAMQSSVEPCCTRKLCRYCPISSRPSK